MKVLLDTCTFLWAVRDPSALSDVAKKLILATENEIYVSAVTSWEIAVKYSIGKLTLSSAPHIYVPTERKRHGLTALMLDEDSALAVGKLPPLHSDPFDRMLICQAITNGMTLLTPDEQIHRYAVSLAW
jgi:PIN domain nuclease of toxin-antitoxin system